jgi:hypothetical protein
VEGGGDTIGSGLADRGPQHLVVWLARKDSNLRSPDPESVSRNQSREPHFERAADRRRPPNRGESGTHSEVSQMPCPKSERVCCPIWASVILDVSRALDRDHRHSTRRLRLALLSRIEHRSYRRLWWSRVGRTRRSATPGRRATAARPTARVRHDVDGLRPGRVVEFAHDDPRAFAGEHLALDATHSALGTSDDADLVGDRIGAWASVPR